MFNSIKKFFYILIIYLSIFISFSLIYLLLFRLSFFGLPPVLFYRGVILLFLTTFIVLVISIIIYKYWLKSNLESITAAIIISFSIHLSLFVVFPVTFERSITMYFLSTLKNSISKNACQGLTKSEFTDRLINNYVIKNDAVGKRIEEQKIIRMIMQNNQCWSLTNRAIKFLNFSQLIKKIYGIN